MRWHRRAGKDDVCLHIGAREAFRRVGNYWHMLPAYTQARKAIWDAVNPHTGKKRIDEAFPKELRKRTNNQEMIIEFVNGSTWQVLGSDNYDNLVGASPAGIIFSEYALANPAAWDYFRPMLAENHGFAFFISTVRGYNHFYQLGEYAKTSKEWFFQEVSADTSGVFTTETLQRELEEIQAKRGEDEGLSIFRQEYFNDPNAAIPGAYYAKIIAKLKDAGQITSVPYEPNLPVTTAWDLGIGDSTAIWFAQQVGKEVRIIDHLENSGVGLDWYVKQLSNKPYVYHEHLLPHDANVSELGTGKRRIDTLRDLGLNKTRVLPALSVDDGINAVRLLLPRCWFDKTKTEKGLNCLINYQREYDEKLQTFKDRPLHDWSSHSSDGFRYLAIGLKPVRERPQGLQFANNDFSL
ncbi:MAG: hypothetical protein EKK54_08085 [Neisseriaceae bacterium]|nr:MAG: hypothetical protein EKK54_08085 [Neisseriaceae bacterium]